MRSGTRPLTTLMLMQATALVCVSGARAEPAPTSQPADASTEDGAEQTATRIRPGAFHLSMQDAWLGFESSYEYRRVKSSAPGKRDSTQTNRDLGFEETMGLRVEGDVVDPNLLSWTAGLEFGLTQDEFREDIDSYHNTDRDTGTLLEYDLSLDLLRSKPFSVNAYARRSDDRIGRRFLPSLHEEVTESGVTGLLLTGPITTEFGFSWRDVERTGNRLEEDDESLENARFFLDSKWEISEFHQLRLSYEHEREESTYQGSLYGFDTRRDEVRVDHELRFGSKHQHRVDTVLRYNEEQGDLARDEVEIVPRLTLAHTEKLQTIWRYTFYRFEQDAVEVEQHKLDGQALYKPDDHWRFTVDGYGLYEREDEDTETYEFGGLTDVAYTHPTSLGEFSANLAFAFDRARTTGNAGRRLVRSEAHRLGDSRPDFLKELNVIVGTVVARNAERTRVYVPGVDYTVVRIGKRTHVARLFTGRIAQNEVVYFDYQYLVPANATADTYRTDLMLEHKFTFGLTPYYYLETRCQNTESSLGSPVYRDNTNRHRLGARYERERWSVGAEYEVFDDTIEPYDAGHLTGRVAVFRSPMHSLDATGELSRYCFEGGVDEREVWWLDLDVKDNMQVDSFWSLVGGLGYHWEDDSVDGTTNGVDVEWGIRFVRGYLTVELVVEYDLLSVLDNREDGLGIWLNIRRNVTDVLLPSRNVR